MTMRLNEQLENLVTARSLVEHNAPVAEIQQHIALAQEHLRDARNKDNSLATRFLIANSAAHMLLMAAIKMHGYRPMSERGHRAVLYQMVDVLLPGAAGTKETLMRAHNARNKAEYDGAAFDVTSGQVDDIVHAAASLDEEVGHLFRGYK
jgi:hypothetical protein